MECLLRCLAGSYQIEKVGIMWKKIGLSGLLMVLNTAVLATTSIKPLLQADQQSDTLTLDHARPVKITAALTIDEPSEQTADWWLYAETRFGLFSAQLSDTGLMWQAGLTPVYQGQLMSIDEAEIWHLPLPAGSYLLHFGVDLSPNGQLDRDQFIKHSLRIHQTYSADQPIILGKVIDLAGQAIANASVKNNQAQTQTDSGGWFSLVGSGKPEWVTVQHNDYLSRTRAAHAGQQAVLFRLTADDGETLSFNFTGDTMAGRRFFDPAEDGQRELGLISPQMDIEEHVALLKPVQPLLANADVTAVNLETPLSAQPYVDPYLPRPAYVHQTKDYVFATHINMPLALQQVGVDIVDLGNNHLYDYMEQGVDETQRALDAVAMPYFGAGFNEDQAWQPAVITVKNQTIAFIGCTTISGTRFPINYVASDADGKGGAAQCNNNKIQTYVGDAVAQYDNVIFMVHGGFEYQREASETVKKYTQAAREAGAHLIINHHPHVTSGLDWDGRSLVAWSLGNFLFDQTVWPTLNSYLLGVTMRRGEVLNAYIEPLMIEDYIPQGLRGEQAEFVARGAWGYSSEGFISLDGGLEADFNQHAQTQTITLPLDSEDEEQFVQIPTDYYVTAVHGIDHYQIGEDILWVGDFEDQDTDTDSNENSLWRLDGVDKTVGTEFAYRGQNGLRLYRDDNNDDDVMLTPLYRILIKAGTAVSAQGKVRANDNAKITLQLSWYPETRGSSSSRTQVPIVIKQDQQWQTFNVNAVAPEDAVAVGLFIKVSPPDKGETEADFDDLRLIAWQAENSEFNPRFNYLKFSGRGEIKLQRQVLSGTQAWQSVPEIFPY